MVVRERGSHLAFSRLAPPAFRVVGALRTARGSHSAALPLAIGARRTIGTGQTAGRRLNAKMPQIGSHPHQPELRLQCFNLLLQLLHALRFSTSGAAESANTAACLSIRTTYRQRLMTFPAYPVALTIGLHELSIYQSASYTAMAL